MASTAVMQTMVNGPGAPSSHATSTIGGRGQQSDVFWIRALLGVLSSVPEVGGMLRRSGSVLKLCNMRLRKEDASGMRLFKQILVAPWEP